MRILEHLTALYVGAAGTLPAPRASVPTPAPSRAFGKDKLQLTAAADKPFPPGFLWGAATAAHQVEGNNTNDWSRFEQIPGKIDNGDKSGVAVRHWEFYEQDLEAARKMNLNAYRFSIEWSRIEPRPGVFDQEAIEHYRKILAACKEKGLKPVVTLHHFTNPLWIADQGGWTNPKTAQDFVGFARRVVAEFKGDVDTWVTFNEPMNVAGGGYVTGHSPPGLKDDMKSFTKVLTNMLTAHAQLYPMIHAIDDVAAQAGGPAAEVGIAHQVVTFAPKSNWNPLDHIFANVAHQTYNLALLDAFKTGTLKFRVPTKLMVDQKIPGLKNTVDFLGINYYTRNLVDSANPTALNYKSADTDMGWEIYPQGLTDLLKEIASRYPQPIYVMENGIADGGRTKQAKYIAQHVDAVHQAIEAGAPVKGMFYWSLVDNFEWNKGFQPRFGLLAIDYDSPEKTRSFTPGAATWGRIAGENALPADLVR